VDQQQPGLDFLALLAAVDRDRYSDGTCHRPSSSR
jgi:hypothetical protein